MLRGRWRAKNKTRASELLLALPENYEPASLYFTFYFKNTKVTISDFSLILSELVSTEDSPYTFAPIFSSSWKNVVEKTDDGRPYLVLSDFVDELDVDKKILVPITATKELPGWVSDNGDAIYLLDPSQGNRFFVENECVVSENGIYLPLNSGYFSYDFISALPNGIQILYVLDNRGGTYTSAGYHILGFQKIKTISYGKIKEFVGIRNFGSISQVRDNKYGYEKNSGSR